MHCSVDSGLLDEREGGSGAEKLPVGFNAHDLGDGINHTPKLSIMQYTWVTNLHVPPILKEKLKKRK